MIDAIKLKEQLQVSLSMKTNEFVTAPIKRLLRMIYPAGSHFDNIAKVLDAFLAVARNFTQQLFKSLDHPVVALAS